MSMSIQAFGNSVSTFDRRLILSPMFGLVAATGCWIRCGVANFTRFIHHFPRPVVSDPLRTHSSPRSKQSCFRLTRHVSHVSHHVSALPIVITHPDSFESESLNLTPPPNPSLTPS